MMCTIASTRIESPFRGGSTLNTPAKTDSLGVRKSRLMEYIGKPENWGKRFSEDVERMYAQSKPISRQVFVVSVNPHDLSELEEKLGYSIARPMGRDWTVCYRRSSISDNNVIYVEVKKTIYLFS